MHEKYMVCHILQGIGCNVLYFLSLLSPCKYACTCVCQFWRSKDCTIVYCLCLESQCNYTCIYVSADGANIYSRQHLQVDIVELLCTCLILLLFLKALDCTPIFQSHAL